MHLHNKRHQAMGFTLVELMLVIVIMSIFAAMVVMSITGVDHRRLMQQREQLINDLAVIRLEAMDQSRIFALIPMHATATQPAGYVIAEYQSAEQLAQKQKNNSKIELNFNQKQQHWLPVATFKERSFSEGAYLQVNALSRSTHYHARQPSIQGLQGDDAPDLIWYGNGETKPVRLQLIQDQQTMGQPIYVDALGRISDHDNSVDAR